jgi:plasmid maintenance system antidote protein VapI
METTNAINAALLRAAAAAVAGGQTVTALARAAAVTQPAMSNWLRGKRGISLETAARLAGALDLELKPRTSRG